MPVLHTMVNLKTKIRKNGCEIKGNKTELDNKERHLERMVEKKIASSDLEDCLKV